VENDGEVGGQLSYLLKLLTLKPVELSCAFFNIDLPLVLSNVSIVVMYLVIISQSEITNS
jgi:hypothetical protein